MHALTAALDLVTTKREAMQTNQAVIDKFVDEAIKRIYDTDYEMITTPSGAVHAMVYWKSSPVLAKVGEAGLVAAIKDKMGAE